MASDFNKVILTGRLAADPDVRYTPNGSEVAQFRIAVNRSYKTKDNPNDWQQETFFITIITWNRLAERVEKNFKKGDLVIVEGRLNIRSYEVDGVKKWVTEIIANDVKFLPRNRAKTDYPAPGEESGDNEPDVPFS
ncbi:MAG: single-stranded DNA-binding protein [Caldisericaceae bacterium]|nr:single-stranded DNA-binding protein [Caldisericaceae bacterium]